MIAGRVRLLRVTLAALGLAMAMPLSALAAGLYSIWTSTQGPAAGEGYIDPSPIEIGVRFQADSAGDISGIRFFKISGNTGTHIGHLWTNTGTLLGTVNFTGETATGWQSANFPSPISIQANTTYVASYHTTRGYAATRSYFLFPRDNAPLHAPASATGALNGVYTYSVNTAFPTQSSRQSNYWIDVSFSVPGSISPTPNPVPSISQLRPSSVTAGGSGFALTVWGANFVSGAVVRWNGASRTTAFVSGSALTASIPASDVVASGEFSITVFNPGPGGGVSNALFFTVAPPPTSTNTVTITDLSPNSVAAGGGAFNLTVDGVNFTSGSMVRWNGIDHPGVRQGTTRLIVYVGPADIAASGTVPVNVFTPGIGLSNTLPFTVTGSGGNPVPSIATLTPSSATAGGAAFTLTVDGGNFNGSSAVRWNSSPRPTTFVSGIRLSAAISAADIAAAGAATVAVFNPSPGGGVSNAVTLVVNPAHARTVVTFTFDDTFTDHVLASQLLDQRGFKGTFFINSPRIGTSSLYMTNADIAALRANGHEIAGHTLTHPDLATLTTAQAQHEICDDRQQLVALGYNPTSFAYPFGSYNASVENIVRGCGYTSARAVGGLDCSGCAVAETVPPLDAYASRTPDSIKSYTTLAGMKKHVTDAELAGGGWVPLVFHRICDNCDPSSVSSTNLGNFMDWLNFRATQGTVVQTYAQAFGAPQPPSSLSSLSPPSATAGGAAFTLTVAGAGFISGSTIQWNGIGRTTTFVSGSTLTASIPASDIASSGTATVTVFNPTPRGGVSSARTFTINRPASSSWTLTGSMAQARNGQMAVKLANGKVLVVAADAAGTAELYDPSAGTWALTGNPHQPGGGWTLTLLANGKVLLTGVGQNGSRQPRAELYDPVAGTWSLTGSMTIGRSLHTATLLPNGKVLVAGGDVTEPTNSAELYDPGTGSWTPTGRMTVSHYSHTATLLSNGKVLVAGGAFYPDSAQVPAEDLYDPATGMWSSAGAMSIIRTEHTATLLSNGKVLVSGKRFGLASAEVYDPASNTWSGTGSMAVPRSNHAAALLTNGQVLVVGNGSDAEVYDPSSGTWSSAGWMSVSRGSPSATLLSNGKVLVAGGGDSSAELYNSPSISPAAAFSDNFNQPDGLITNQNASSSRSDKWLVTNGSLFTSGAQGWTGVPDNVIANATSTNGTGSAFFRALSVPSNIGSDVTARVTVQGFVSARPIGNWDGAHIYLRYLDAGNYYQLSVYRRDGRAAIKKRRNGIESTFTTPLYGAAPIGTPQSARALAITNTNGSVTIQFYINDVLAASAVDTANPITAFGKVAMAGENTNFKFDDFTVIPPAGGTGVAAATAGSPPSLSFAPATRLVKSEYGGRVERVDATGVNVPENALAADLEITVNNTGESKDADIKRQKRLEKGIQPASDEIAYAPSNTRFKEPVTVVLGYNPATVAAAGLKEEELKVYSWNLTLGDWEVLASVVDKEARTVSAATKHFSIYQVMGAGDGIGVAAADPSFGLKALYAFPNPVRGVSDVTIRIQPGIADSVEVHVYDVAGRKVHSSSDFRNSGALDDGNGLGPQFTYDHVWNISGVGSGVYTYVITARKAREGDIRKSGKVGIVK